MIMKIKKIIALVLAFCLCFAFAACDGTTDGGSGSGKKSSSKSEGVPGSSKFVGRWEKCFYSNSDDPSFEEYAELTLLFGGGLQYIEFYSNGTGRTSCYVGSICDGGGVPFKWSYDEETKELRITAAVKSDDDPSGYDTLGKVIRDPAPKKSYILSKYDTGSHESVEFEERIETVSYPFLYWEPMAKVESDEFVDNRDLKCPEAFAAIDKELAE
jgi:hypothetical protein